MKYNYEYEIKYQEVDGLLGTGSYTEIVPAIESLLEEKTVVSYGSIDTPEAETGRILTTPAHYAFVKIAEGCDNRCAYCIIPYLRGRYRSRQMEDIVAEAESLAENGVKELIVVAQDTSRYGTDLPGHKRLLPALLRRLCRIDGLHWIRVHYVYPDEIDDELISVIAEEPKIVKYLDIPIQHCNDQILKRMNRRGDGAFLRSLLKKLRDRIPGLVIRTSLIAGLPGEGEAEFHELLDFLKETRMERVGTFVFSPEEGTPAARMEHVDADTAAGGTAPAGAGDAAGSAGHAGGHRRRRQLSGGRTGVVHHRAGAHLRRGIYTVMQPAARLERGGLSLSPAPAPLPAATRRRPAAASPAAAGSSAGTEGYPVAR